MQKPIVGTIPNTIKLLSISVGAIKYKTTVPRVERAIRHAIEVSCNRVECSVLHDYFGYSLSYEKSRPTNSEFLTTIADRLKFKVIDEKII